MTTQFPSLLAVDDDPDCLQLMQLILGHEGYQLQTVSDPCLVLKTLGQSKIDLILLDFHMPCMSGIELCRQIKAETSFAKIPVIFATAEQDENILAEAFEAGAVDYLTKPYKREEILARVRTHLALRESERLLQNKLAFSELMLTMLAHDLRGPISAASDYIRHLMLTPYSQIELLTRMQILSNSIQSTHHILDQTLQWVCSIQDEIPFRPAWSELSLLAKECIGQYHLKALEKEISLTCDIPASTFAFVDPDMLRTMLLNLINNAMKFTPNQGSVTLTAEFSIAEVKLSVTDSGSGMPPEQVAKLAEQAALKSKTGTAGEKGTGLGLKICPQMADRHGGQIEINSTQGKGSTFSLRLPGAARFEPA